MATRIDREELDPEFDVSIAGLDPAAVLAALYNAAHPVGMGFLQARSAAMTVDQARDELAWYLEHDQRFDYLHGRPLKFRFDGDVLRRVDLYNQDQGHGQAQRIIADLRQEQHHDDSQRDHANV